jgi:tryptophanyl-tRNA synthetase
MEEPDRRASGAARVYAASPTEGAAHHGHSASLSGESSPYLSSRSSADPSCKSSAGPSPTLFADLSDNLSPNPPTRDAVLSGMRPTGALHLGHYHGALINWVALQDRYRSFFFVADWHALTTHYESPEAIRSNIREMVIDWLAAGIDPERSVIFVQSHLPQHAELHLLLSMCTPLGWLERVPSYKDQQANLSEKDLTTYGFLGYPLLQAADILMYQAAWVPVGEDQVPHVELTREVARRFNHLYGRETDLDTRMTKLLSSIDADLSRELRAGRQAWLEGGDHEALRVAQQRVGKLPCDPANRQRLRGWLAGGGRQILREPEALLTEASRLPGVDGRKMSKSYGNAIAMRDDPAQVETRIRRMPTDPARVRRTDPGDPQRCPVWELHKVYCPASVRSWVQEGCRAAAIGCMDCKRPLIDAVLDEQQRFRQRAEPYLRDPEAVDAILRQGYETAADVAEQTMVEVRSAMGLMARL